MKKTLFIFFSHFLLATSYSQQNYWQQQVNYTIDVSLNDKENTLDAFEKIEYINHSPDTLTFIWFHIWPNAYKNDRTAFSEQLLENGSTNFYFSNKEQKGYINRLDFKVNNITAQTEDHPQYIDIIKVLLPSPLPPGQKIIITTPFHEKLPYNFSRGGYDGQSYQVTQWYPKPAVYDSKGWHPMPYLDQGEYYSEFGSFDVRITVPENYVVAATGELQNDNEKQWLKTRATYQWKPIRHTEKTSAGISKTTLQLFPESSKEIKIVEYKQNNIHDFAWFADKRFIVNTDTCLLASGKIITVYTYYTPANKKNWQASVGYSKNAIHHYSNLVGEYPYNIVQVVQGPESFGGGMEYPTITVISPGQTSKGLDITIAHEIGHNWFYGVLATNERDHPWMDEGINTFYEDKYYTARYGEKPPTERIFFETKAITKTDQPINTTSEKFSEANYGLVAYYKTAAWMQYMESQLGSAVFEKAMQDYFRNWQFKHPQPEDFKKAITESSGKNTDSLFSYLDKRGILPNQQRTGNKTVFLFHPKAFKPYLKSPSKNLFTTGPVIGFNSYDKLMVGAFITNIKLPPSNLQFLAAPMYATGSKKLNGLGFLYNTFYPPATFRKIEVGVSASSFTDDEYLLENGKKVSLSFYKIVPGIKLTFKEKTPRSTLNKYIQFKTFIIGEDALRFFKDTAINGIDTLITDKYRILSETRLLTQLQLVIENNRALYPYRGELRAEQSNDFLRIAFTGNYFFNYAKQGGLSVRFFAGKFFYTTSKNINKQFDTDRFHLNMTGANGYEDYTYSDYFIGRNRFQKIASQQIMMRDGGFKIRTDLLSDKIAKTDNWLMAANFSSTIPAAVNPFSLLPFKVPLKLFFDIGTYAEAWQPNAETDRFLYDGGIQVALFKETINIYVPLIYSNVYKNYIRSTIEKKGRLLKTISFTIDVANFNFRKIDRRLEF